MSGNNSTAAWTGAEESVADVDLEKLYPALVECFGIVFLGYLAAKFSMVSEVESRGLAAFTGTFALPALVFRSLVILDFGAVSWSFLTGILVSKAVLFAVVVLGSLLALRPADPARAGLFAIFVTQSNDFALGYPILEAMYGHSYPQIPMYMYLMAPISLVILNPIGFVLMEYSAAGRNNGDQQWGENSSSGGRINVLNIAKNIATNPIIFMTVAGVAANFIFSQQLPAIFDSLLHTLGSAFSACALFLLGIRIVATSEGPSDAKDRTMSAWVVPTLLILLKTVAYPLLARETVSAFISAAGESEGASLLRSGSNGTTDDTELLSDFAFLYGTFPTAPSVFVYATQYDLETKLVASTMVVCTFVAAPIMFVSARLLSLTNIDPTDYIDDLTSFLLDISIAGLTASVWTVMVLLVTKKFVRVPHFMTVALVISQGISSIGAIFWSAMNCGHGWKLYLQFVFLAYGVFSNRVNTALLALAVFLAHVHPTCWLQERKKYFYGAGFGVPAVLVLCLLLFVGHETTPHGERVDPNFQYGETQAVVALCVLAICFVFTVVCLVLTQRRRHQSSLMQQQQGQQPQPRQQQQPEQHRDEAHRRLLDLTESEESDQSRTPPNYRAVEHTGTAERQSPIPIEDLLQLEEGDREEEEEREEAETVCCEDERQVRREERRRQLQQQQQPGGGSNSGGARRRRYRCNTEHREYCSSLLQSYAVPPAREAALDHGLSGECPREDAEEAGEGADAMQFTRHVFLLLMLVTTMFVGLAFCLWTLVMKNKGGAYLELVFLDGFLNFGQPLFSFALFGLDYKYMTVPLQHWYRQLVYGADSLVLPQWEDLSQETKQHCQQFLKHHVSRCVPALARDLRSRLTVHRGVFRGSDLVDWLCEVGLARDRADAVIYARHLVKGRVIRHVDNYLDFYDDCFLYTFQPSSHQADSASSSNSAARATRQEARP